MASIPEHLLEFRKILVAADQKAQEDFDKTVLSLSGGALGVSLVFLKDVVAARPVVWGILIVVAWIAWALSMLAVLISYHCGHMTIRQRIQRIDAGISSNEAHPGGRWGKVTERLNLAGALLFFVGVVCLILFACANFSTKGGPNADTTHPAAIAAPAPSAASAADAIAGPRK